MISCSCIFYVTYTLWSPLSGAFTFRAACTLWNPCPVVSLRQEGETGGQKISLAYIKVQPVMELLLFMESQKFRL